MMMSCHYKTMIDGRSCDVMSYWTRDTDFGDVFFLLLRFQGQWGHDL